MISKPSGTAKKVASNTIYQLLGKVFSLSVTVLVTIGIARFYGRDLYGRFSLMQSWPAIFTVILDFGVNAIATRVLSTDWAKAQKYISNILSIRLLFSVIVVSLLSIILLFLPYDTNLKIGIFLSLFILMSYSIYSTFNILFQVNLRYDLSVRGYIFGYIFVLLTVPILMFFKMDVMFLNLMYVLGSIITVLTNIFYAREVFGIKFSLNVDLSFLKTLLLQAYPIGLMFVFSQINFKSDTILMSVLKLPSRYNLSNTDTVALYSLPYKLFEVGLVVPTFFMNATYPVLVRHLHEDVFKFKRTLFKSLGLLAVIAVGGSIVGIILAPSLISLIGGNSFSMSVDVLRILVGGAILYFITQPLAWTLVVLTHQKYLPVIYAISAVFNVVTNLIFIPRYSIYASAIITHLSELLILSLLIFFNVKSWKMYLSELKSVS